MLPCHMQARGKLFPGHYIYAAATLPAYRGRGYMASLMAAAALEGAGRGQMFSAVLPAEESLYAYYDSELSCSRELVPQLRGALLREAPAERYRFRLPVGKGRELFGREGKRTPFGMVKSLSGWEIPRLAECGPPWLSFPLD